MKDGFFVPTVPLGSLPICLLVCYCIWGTLASAMLNNASLSPNLCWLCDKVKGLRKQQAEIFLPAFKSNRKIKSCRLVSCCSAFITCSFIQFMYLLKPLSTNVTCCVISSLHSVLLALYINWCLADCFKAAFSKGLHRALKVCLRSAVWSATTLSWRWFIAIRSHTKAAVTML